MEKKKAADKERLDRKRAGSAMGSGNHAMDEDDDNGAGSSVREFARRQGEDAVAHDGDSVMVWGILEGQPEKVHYGLRYGTNILWYGTVRHGTVRYGMAWRTRSLNLGRG